MSTAMMTPRRAQPKPGVPPAALMILTVAACAEARPDTPRYRTAPVERRDVVRRIEASGRIVASPTHAVAPATSGVLVEVSVVPGASVAAGTELGRLDARAAALDLAALRAQERGAKAGARRARAEHAAARAQAARVARLADRNRASVAELEAARAEAAVAAAAEKQAEAAVEVAVARRKGAELAVGRSVLTAPRDGVVLTVPEGLGQPVVPGGPPLFLIAESLDPIAVEVDVAEADVAQLAPGQIASLEVPAFPGRRFEAHVRRVALTARQVGGLAVYRATLMAANPNGELRVGMTARLQLDVAREPAALAVKDAALRFRPPSMTAAPPRSRVFVLRDAQLVSVPVELGVEDGAFSAVQPREGHRLEVGELVVIGRWWAGTSAPGSQFSIGGGG